MKTKTIVVGFDEHCSICQKTARLFFQLDRNKKIIIDKAHTPSHELLQKIDKAKRIRRIYSVNLITHKVSSGYDTIIELIKVLPAGMLLLPVLWIIKKIGIGDYIYNKIADASWRNSCKNGFCDLP